MLDQSFMKHQASPITQPVMNTLNLYYSHTIPLTQFWAKHCSHVK